MKGEIGLFALLLCCPALAAGERFVADFEGPLLKTDMPAGVWDALNVWPGSVQSLTPLAATRGLNGLRIDDQSNAPGPGDSTAVYALLSGPAMTQAQLRLRFRPTSSSQEGSVVIAQALSAAANRRSLCDLSLVFPEALLTLGGDSRSGSFTTTDSGVRLDGGSVLLECLLRGLGTDAGERSLYVDGERVVLEPVDFSGLALNEVAIGEPYSEDRRFVGHLDFDDVRLADRMQASRLTLDAGRTALDEGACAAVQLAVTDSEGALAGLPYAAVLSSTVAGAALYGDSACSVALANVSLTLEQTTEVVFLRAGSAAQLTFSVSFPDLVGITLVLPIRLDGGSTDAGTTDAGSPDGGSRGGALGSDFKVGCGCDSGSGAPLLWLGCAALAFLARRSVRRRSAKP